MPTIWIEWCSCLFDYRLILSDSRDSSTHLHAGCFAGSGTDSRHKVMPKALSRHYCDVIMSAMASQITDVSFVYSTVCSGADQSKHQSSASLVFVRGIHRWPMTSPHKGPVTRKMFPFDVKTWYQDVMIRMTKSDCLDNNNNWHRWFSEML